MPVALLAKLTQRLKYFFTSLGLGLFITYLILGGFSRLNPRRFDWIFGDNITAYLSQLFFLRDKWRIPLTANPTYGLEHSTPLTYTGPNLPLTLIQKLFQINPELQFFGLWILMTVSLQILFALLLAKELDTNFFQAVLFSLLSVMPFFLARFQLHFWLTAHFLILWSLLIAIRYFKQGRLQTFHSLILISLSLLIAPYILMMVLVILLFVAINSVIGNQISRQMFIRHCFLMALTIVFTKSIFDGLGTQTNAYESFKMNFSGPDYGKFPYNLASFLNPDVGLENYYLGMKNNYYLTTNFSSTGISFGSTPGSYEGFLYLGAGVIFLLTFAFLTYRRRPTSEPFFVYHLNKKLFGFFFFLVLSFSVTFNVGLGNLKFSLPFPYLGTWALSAFRASGRFMWIIAYTFLVIALVQLTRRITKPLLTWILMVAVTLQVADISVPVKDRYLSLRNELPPVLKFIDSDYENFTKFAIGKSKIVSFPPGHGTPQWDRLNYWAWKNDMVTNSNQSGRINFDLLKRQTKKTFFEICEGEANYHNLYVVSLEFFGDFSSCDLTRFQIEDIGDLKILVLK